MNIYQTLKDLGINEKQAAAYFTLLQMGSGTIQEIVKKSSLKRTTAYSVLDVLIEKGFVTVVKNGKHRKYSAEDPKKLPQLFENKLFKIKQQQKSIKKAMPELESFFNAHSTKPKIRFYEGVEGLKQAMTETLETDGDEILAYSSADSIHEYLGNDYVKYYLAERGARKITQRAIVEDSPVARIHKNNDKQELRETRLLDGKLFPFSNEINIFKNKMVIISYPDLLAVIIESDEVVKTQKTIFELAWLGAKQIENK